MMKSFMAPASPLSQATLRSMPPSNHAQSKSMTPVLCNAKKAMKITPATTAVILMNFLKA